MIQVRHPPSFGAKFIISTVFFLAGFPYPTSGSFKVLHFLVTEGQTLPTEGFYQNRFCRRIWVITFLLPAQHVGHFTNSKGILWTKTMVILIISENCRKYLGISFIPNQHSDFKFQTRRASFYTLLLSNFNRKLTKKLNYLKNSKFSSSLLSLWSKYWWYGMIRSQLGVAR